MTVYVLSKFPKTKPSLNQIKLVHLCIRFFHLRKFFHLQINMFKTVFLNVEMSQCAKLIKTYIL